jgi:hypothetical protein
MFNIEEQCPISNTNRPITYLDLGMMPLVNNLNNSKEESLSCPKFPLAVNLHPQSKLSMLSGVVDPDTLFANYVYKSGTSQPYIDHCKEMFSYISRHVQVSNGDRFIDIGGNDGTLLKTFKTINPSIDVLNVDPSINLASVSKDNGVNVLTTMWDESIGATVGHTCKVITSTNVFQHTKPIRSFVKGISTALTDDGIWCLEFPYWKKSMDTLQYDQVYHEHIYYYLLTPLNDLFEQEGLEIIDVMELEIHGGSLRVISRRKNDSPFDNSSVKKCLDAEKSYNLEKHTQFAKVVEKHISDSKELINAIRESGNKIVGFGAAAKGCVWLNACGFTDNHFDYVVDDTDVKQGKYIPGTGIQIVNRSHLKSNTPNLVVILAHNFSDYIMNSLRKDYKGKFLVMFPEPKFYE